MDELYTAERGGGAFLNDRRLRVAGRSKLADAVIGTGMPHLGRGHHGNYLVELRNVMAEVSGIRRLGAAALDLAYVAAGRLDGFWEDALSPWDVAAGILMIREAGGFVTDRHGGQDMFDSGSIVAGNEAIHRALLKTLEEAARRLKLTAAACAACPSRAVPSTTLSRGSMRRNTYGRRTA